MIYLLEQKSLKMHSANHIATVYSVNWLRMALENKEIASLCD